MTDIVAKSNSSNLSFSPFIRFVIRFIRPSSFFAAINSAERLARLRFLVFLVYGAVSKGSKGASDVSNGDIVDSKGVIYESNGVIYPKGVGYNASYVIFGSWENRRVLNLDGTLSLGGFGIELSMKFEGIVLRISGC